MLAAIQAIPSVAVMGQTKGLFATMVSKVETPAVRAAVATVDGTKNVSFKRTEQAVARAVMS